jgi:hypothetical protein
VKARSIAVLTGLALSAALVFGLSSATAKPKAKHASCTVTLYDQSGPTATTGFDFGFVTCPAPFGRGLQSDSFRTTVGAGGIVTITGGYTEWFGFGTFHGRFKVTGTTTSTALNGTATIVGGTGAYKNAAGSARLACRGSATNNKTVCSSKVTYTGV